MAAALVIKALLRLYPPSWRRRYGREMEVLVEDLPSSRLTVAVDLIYGAAAAYATVIRGNRILSTAAAFLHGLCVTVLLQAIGFVTLLLLTQNASTSADLRIGPFAFLTINRTYFLNGIYEHLHAAMWIEVVVNWEPELAALIALIAALGLVLAAPRLLRAVR